MAAREDRPTPPLNEIERSLRGLELNTVGIRRETIKMLIREEGISRESAKRVGKRAMNLVVPVDAAELTDQLAKRMGLTSRAAAVELAVRYTVRSIHRAEVEIGSRTRKAAADRARLAACAPGTD